MKIIYIIFIYKSILNIYNISHYCFFLIVISHRFYSILFYFITKCFQIQQYWILKSGKVFTSHACHVFLSDGDTLPLSQPQSAHGTLAGGSSCPGTPEMRRRQEEALRRLASQVPTNINIINRARHMTSLPLNLPLFSSIDLLSLCVPVFLCLH